MINPFKILGIIDSLLIPIQRAISAVLPDFVEASLDDPATRQRLVEAADDALISSHPEARLVPEPARRRLIAKFVDILLDDIALPD
ncbi:MAG TPA: hypothetical protein VMN36_15480 [Verrucomicrobiales bacterium]|nr:hypothetical protein [Verrucomicrobiales bacterium]